MANIAVDVRPLGQPLTGIGRYTNEILSRLLKHNEHNWFLYSNRPIPSAPDNAKIRIAPRPLQNSFLCSQLLFPYWARRDAIDSFWAPRHHLPTLLQAPSLLSIHDLAWKVVPKTMPASRRLQERLLMPTSVAKATLIAAVSEATKQQIQEAWPRSSSKTRVVTLGRASFRTELPRIHQRPFILIVGTFEPRKNHYLVLNAFREVAPKIEHDLIIAGRPGWGNIDIPSAICSSGLQQRVQILADPDDETLANYYQHADFLVAPSIYEGFDLPILEALTFGTPILATDTPIHREVAGHAAHYFTTDKESLSKTLLLTLTDIRIRSALAQHCKEQAAQFNWETSTSKILGYLEDIIA